MSQSLYKIAEEIDELQEKLEELYLAETDENEEEMTDEKRAEYEKEIIQSLKDLDLDFEKKSDSIAYIIKKREVNAKFIKSERNRLNTRREVEESVIKRLKKYQIEQMQTAGIKKVIGNYQVSWQDGNPAIETKDDFNAEILPLEFKKIVAVISDPEIWKLIQERGEEIITIEPKKTDLLEYHKKKKGFPPEWKGIFVKQNPFLKIA